MKTILVLLIIIWIILYFKIKKVTGNQFRIIHENVSYMQGLIFLQITIVLVVLLVSRIVYISVKYLP